MPVPADLYGLLEIPASAPDDGSPAGDPALRILGEFLQAYLNEYAQQIWGTPVAPGTGVAPGQKIVEKVFYHDPRRAMFSDSAGPAMYLFRNGSKGPPEYIADDIRVTNDTISVWWILQSATQVAIQKREPVLHAVAKYVDAAISGERAPCYSMTGDTDPEADTEGTHILSAMKVQRLMVSSYKPEALVIRANGKIFGPYQGMMISVEIQEPLYRGHDNEDPNAATEGTFSLAPSADAGAFDFLDYQFNAD